METIKYTIGLVFQLVFGVAAIGTYLIKAALSYLMVCYKKWLQVQAYSGFVFLFSIIPWGTRVSKRALFTFKNSQNVSRGRRMT